jgi:hypothetical protein
MYAYVHGDPVNFMDRHGLEEQSTGDGGCDPDLDCNVPECYDASNEFLGMPDPGCPTGGGGGDETPTTTAAPDCTSQFLDYQVSFVQANYQGAATVASGYTKTDAATLSVAFLDWGAWESGWNQKPLGTVNHNFFGMHPGSWGGLASPSCPAGAVPGAACFPAGTSYQAELTAALAGGTGSSIINPNPNHLSYGQDIAQALTSNPNATAATLLQAIANGGWNASGSYGATLSKNSGTIQSIITCLQSLGRI